MSESPETDPAQTRLHIDHHEADGVLVIAVAGEVDLGNVSTLHNVIAAGIDRTHGEPCILDLTAVTFLGSAGLKALVESTAHAEARQEPLRIVVDANRPVIRPIEVTGLDDVLRLYHSVEEAVKAGRA